MALAKIGSSLLHASERLLACRKPRGRARRPPWNYVTFSTKTFLGFQNSALQNSRVHPYSIYSTPLSASSYILFEKAKTTFAFYAEVYIVVQRSADETSLFLFYSLELCHVIIFSWQFHLHLLSTQSLFFNL